MNYETVERCGGCIHVVKNGVESEWFVFPGNSGYAMVYCPVLYDQVTSLREALEIIAEKMDTWYTVPQAAQRLVELGAAAKPPAAQTMYRWLRAGRFPGAVRCGPGRGGGWRIPETSLAEFAERRKER